MPHQPRCVDPGGAFPLAIDLTIFGLHAADRFRNIALDLETAPHAPETRLTQDALPDNVTRTGSPIGD